MKKIFALITMCLLFYARAASAIAPPSDYGNYFFIVNGCSSYVPGPYPSVPASYQALCLDAGTGALYVWNGTAFALYAGYVVADVAVGEVLTSGGVGSPPVYSATPQLGIPGTTSGTISLSNATGSGYYTEAQAATTTTYTETTKAVVPAQGDILDYSNGSGQRSSLVDVAAGSVVVSGGVGAVPVYSATPSVTSITATGTGDKAIVASVGGHISSLIGAGSIPTCGTGTVTAISTDNAMEVTGATSPATVTFHTAFAAQPVCVCNDVTSALGACKAVANSNGATVVVTTTGTDSFDMVCIGH